MQDARLYSDEEGASHFEPVEIDLMPNDYPPPSPSLDLSAFTPATRFGFVLTQMIPTSFNRGSCSFALRSALLRAKRSDAYPTGFYLEDN
jgi:hypothetical protein